MVFISNFVRSWGFPVVLVQNVEETTRFQTLPQSMTIHHWSRMFSLATFRTLSSLSWLYLRIGRFASMNSPWHRSRATGYWQRFWTRYQPRTSCRRNSKSLNNYNKFEFLPFSKFQSKQSVQKELNDKVINWINTRTRAAEAHLTMKMRGTMSPFLSMSGRWDLEALKVKFTKVIEGQPADAAMAIA